MKLSNRLIINFYIVLLSFGLSTNTKAQEISNLQLLVELADSLLNDVPKEAFIDSSKSVLIRSLQPNEEVDWFIENRIVEVLKRKNISTILLYQKYKSPKNKGENGRSITIIEYKVLALGIEYVDQKGGALFGSGLIKRKGKIGLFLRFINQPLGEIVWNGEVEGTRFDWFTAKVQTSIENPNIPFTLGKYLLRTGKSKIYEPILITGVTGIIVFLFFSLRSR